MARLISAKGVVAGGTIGSPAEGMKWIVRWALLIYHFSSTTGNRSAFIAINRANNAFSAGTMLATTGIQTATSGIYVAAGDVSSTGEGGGTITYTPYYNFLEIFAVDVLYLAFNGQSGDAVDYYIMVEEASS